MAEITTLQMDTEVTVKLPDMTIKGLVVGKASNSIAESYIIKCIDGQLPNNVYKYNTFIAQLYMIHLYHI